MLSLVLVAALAPPPTIAIEHVTVVRPGSDKSSQDQTVVVQNGRIVTIGNAGGAKIPQGATKVDGHGKFLIPGLWDMHVHLESDKALAVFTANGVTGIRVMFGFPPMLEWRKRAESGEIVGPRMVVGSPIVDGPKPVWQGSIAVSGEDDARAAVRKIKADGYDFVKVYSLLSRKSFHAIADECKKLNFPFAGHVPSGVGLVEAAQAGQQSSEHLMGLVFAGSTKDQELREKIEKFLPEGMSKWAEDSKPLVAEATATFDKAKYEEALDETAKYKMWQCPTLVVLRSIAYLDEAKPDDPRLKYMSKEVAESWDPNKDFRFKSRTKEDWAAAKVNYKKTAGYLSDMHRHGVKVIAGTDCLNPYVFPGFSLPDELGLIVQAGYSPSEALAAATTNAAEFLGQSKVAGKVERGYRADLVLLDSDPLKDIANVKRVFAVIQRGKLFDRAALNGLLKGAEYPADSVHIFGVGLGGDE